MVVVVVVVEVVVEVVVVVVEVVVEVVVVVVLVAPPQSITFNEIEKCFFCLFFDFFLNLMLISWGYLDGKTFFSPIIVSEKLSN